MAVTISGSDGVTFPDGITQSQGMAYFQSAEQTITAAGSLTIAHGLGRKPTLIAGFLICKTAQAGYSIGDEICIGFVDTNTNNGVTVVPDATNLVCRYGSAASTFIGLNKTTGASISLTNTNFRLILRAWS